MLIRCTVKTEYSLLAAKMKDILKEAFFALTPRLLQLPRVVFLQELMRFTSGARYFRHIVLYDKGAIVSGTTHGHVQISEPFVGGEAVRTLSDHRRVYDENNDADDDCAVTDIVMRNGILVSASTDGTVIAYTPSYSSD